MYGKPCRIDQLYGNHVGKVFRTAVPVQSDFLFACYSDPKIGVRADLTVLLPDGEAHEVLSRVLRRYTRGREYVAALAAPDAMRHDLAGNPVEPVAEARMEPRPVVY